MKKLLFGIFAIVFFQFFAINIFAEQWTVSVVQDFPPYAYSEDGNIKGIHTDIAKSVLDLMQVKYTLKAYPWKRVVAMTDQARVTFSLTWVEKPERFEKYLMIGPIQDGRTVFAVRKNSQIKFNELADLKGHSIGTISGYAYPKEFDKATFLTKDPATINNASLIKKLIAKRNDIIIGDENVLAFEAKKLGVSDKIKFLPKPLKVVYRYAVFPKAHKEQATKFGNALNDFKADKAAYQSVINKYR